MVCSQELDVDIAQQIYTQQLQCMKTTIYTKRHRTTPTKLILKESLEGDIKYNILIGDRNSSTAHAWLLEDIPFP